MSSSVGKVNTDRVPGLVLSGRAYLKAGQGLSPCEEFKALGERGAPFEPSDLPSIC